MRYGFRQLRLNPGFASIAILTLALGIGANTALFSVVRNVILKPLPFRDPERLARVWMDNRRLQMREDWASYLNYVDYKRLSTSFESMAAFTEPTVNVISDGEPERVRGANAEAELFEVLGAKPLVGRVFTKDEEKAGKNDVAVIAYGLWQRRFGGADAVGKSLDFDGRRVTVIGVMPKGFAFPMKTTEFWSPLVVSEQARQARVGYFLQMVARLKPGVMPEQAQTQMDVVARQLEQQYPDANAGYGVYVNPLENHVAGNVEDAAVRAARRGRLRPADCVRKRRRPVSRARRSARPRDRRAIGDRREPRNAGQPAVDGSRGACDSGRRRRHCRCVRRCARPRVAGTA